MNSLVTQLYQLVGYDPSIPITNLSELMPVLFKVMLALLIIGSFFKMIRGLSVGFSHGFRL